MFLGIKSTIVGRVRIREIIFIVLVTFKFAKRRGMITVVLFRKNIVVDQEQWLNEK